MTDEPTPIFPIRQLAIALGIVGAVIVVAYLWTLIAAPDPKPVSAEEAKRLVAEAGAPAAQREAEARAEAEDLQAKRREREITGEACLSAWDGSAPTFVDLIKENLRDPSSFEHVKTRIWREDAEGRHKVAMEFRAKNRMGGIDIGLATGFVTGIDCKASIDMIQMG